MAIACLLVEIGLLIKLGRKRVDQEYRELEHQRMSSLIASVHECPAQAENEGLNLAEMARLGIGLAVAKTMWEQIRRK